MSQPADSRDAERECPVGVFIDWQNCYRSARDAFGFYGSGIDGNIKPLPFARALAAARLEGQGKGRLKPLRTQRASRDERAVPLGQEVLADVDEFVLKTQPEIDDVYRLLILLGLSAPSALGRLRSFRREIQRDAQCAYLLQSAKELANVVAGNNQNQQRYNRNHECCTTRRSAPIGGRLIER